MDEVKISEKEQKQEWSEFSRQRLDHYMYQLQSRKATASDLVAVWAYLEALRDNYLITQAQKDQLFHMANSLHSHKVKHFEPYEKIPWKDIVEKIEKIAKEP